VRDFAAMIASFRFFAEILKSNTGPSMGNVFQHDDKFARQGMILGVVLGQNTEQGDFLLFQNSTC